MNSNKESVGKTKDTGFQVGARRTFAISAERAWKVLTSRRATAIWLGAGTPPSFSKGATYRLDDGSAGEVGVVSSGSHLRLTWQPGGWPRASTVQLRVIPRDSQTIVSFHQEHLPGPDEREERKAHYLDTLDALGSLLVE